MHPEAQRRRGFRLGESPERGKLRAGGVHRELARAALERPSKRKQLW